MNALWRLVSTVSTILVAVVLAIGIALLMSGAIRTDRLAEAVSALREGPPTPPAPSAEEPRGPEEAERRQAAEGLLKREEELRRLDVRVAARQAQVEADRQRVAEAAARLAAEREKFDQERQETVRTKTDADLAANVPILSKMDGASIVAVLKGWDDATFVRYLRALKPSKAAEALDAVQNDPKFEPEFRRLPPGAPRGARTRAELLMEEFRKAPQG